MSYDRDPLEILLELRSAPARAPMSALAQEFGFSLLPHEQIPEDAFNELLTMLESPEFLAAEESWKLVNQLRINWHLSSDAQHAALRPLLIRVFDRFVDSTGAMVIAEILGESFCDEEAVQQLAQLATQARMPARALAPYGLGVLARTTPDTSLRQRALGRLRLLEKDRVLEVRDEAIRALAKYG